MEIEIKGKKYTLKELPYIDAVSLNPDNRAEVVKIMFSRCLGMTDEEINSLNIEDGKTAEKAVLEFNGFGVDFQNSTEKKE